MINDGGTSLVCKKCGWRTTTRQYALCLGFLLLLSSGSDLLHLRIKRAFNHLRGAELFFRISFLSYYEALDLLSKLRFNDKGNHGHTDSANEDGKRDLTLSEILNIVFCFSNSIRDEQEERLSKRPV